MRPLTSAVNEPHSPWPEKLAPTAGGHGGAPGGGGGGGGAGPVGGPPGPWRAGAGDEGGARAGFGAAVVSTAATDVAVVPGSAAPPACSVPGFRPPPPHPAVTNPHASAT